MASTCGSPPMARVFKHNQGKAVAILERFNLPCQPLPTCLSLAGPGKFTPHAGLPSAATVNGRILSYKIIYCDNHLNVCVCVCHSCGTTSRFELQDVAASAPPGRTKGIKEIDTGERKASGGSKGDTKGTVFRCDIDGKTGQPEPRRAH